MTIENLRQEFPHTAESRIYVNHAATSPLSRRVTDAMGAYTHERQGRSDTVGIDNYEAFAPVVEATRQRAADLLGTQSARVAFVQNTSSALGVLAQGLDWQAGDRIAVPACEFPANVYPFMNLERRGVALDFIPHDEGTFTLEQIEAALTPQTRLLTLSWVQFLSGFRTDLDAVGRLCSERDIIFCVDAIQGLGALQLDVEACGIDFLAAGGHKWLMATQGLGLLYVTEALQERLAPPAGWLHGPVDWDDFFNYDLAFHPEARRFEIGTRNHLGHAALHAALGLRAEAGPVWCEEQVLARARQLADGLAGLGFARYGTDDPAHASGIVTVRHPRAAALYEHLRERGITAALRNGLLRFAPTYYNTAAETEAVLEAVAVFAPASIDI